MAKGEPLEGFRRNYLDSLVHALSHYDALSIQGSSFHDRKWAILSVAHAAEVFCNLLLTVLTPRRPRGQYPRFGQAIKHLQKHKEADRLSPGERHVIGYVLPPLAKLRNPLMHEPVPEQLEIGDATLALLALIYLSRRHMSVSTSNLFDRDPPIETDVLGELSYREQERWFVVAEQLVSEDYGVQNLHNCDNCGRFAVTPDLGCQACFDER